MPVHGIVVDHEQPDQRPYAIVEGSNGRRYKITPDTRREGGPSGARRRGRAPKIGDKVLIEPSGNSRPKHGRYEVASWDFADARRPETPAVEEAGSISIDKKAGGRMDVLAMLMQIRDELTDEEFTRFCARTPSGTDLWVKYRTKVVCSHHDYNYIDFAQDILRVA